MPDHSRARYDMAQGVRYRFEARGRFGQLWGEFRARGWCPKKLPKAPGRRDTWIMWYVGSEQDDAVMWATFHTHATVTKKKIGH